MKICSTCRTWTSSAAAACRPSAWWASPARPSQSLPEYLQHLIQILPESYRASRDYKDYVQALTEVAEEKITAEQAAGRMPTLRRVGGACPCSKSVRWVVDDPSIVTPGVAEPAAVPVAYKSEGLPMSVFNRVLVTGLPVVPKPIVGRVASRYVAGETLDDAVGVDP